MEMIRQLTGWDRSDRRRILQIVLGVIWLVDAALQFQPYMFTRSFVTGVLEPSAQGVPGFLGDAITAMSRFLLAHIAEWNFLFATIQLGIAIGLLLRPVVRLALALSIGWAVLVWWFGEGFGGLFASVNPIMGLPGAVILYAILAVLLWPPGSGESANDEPELSVAERSPLHPVAARLLWAVLWVTFAWYLLLPANTTPGALNDLVSGMGPGEPGWIQALDRAIAGGLADNGLAVSIVLAAACALIADAVFLRRGGRSLLAVAIVFSVLVWLAEDFGGVFTGSGTDVNTGPLLVLLVLAYWKPRSAVPRTATALPVVRDSVAAA